MLAKIPSYYTKKKHSNSGNKIEFVTNVFKNIKPMNVSFLSLKIKMKTKTSRGSKIKKIISKKGWFRGSWLNWKIKKNLLKIQDFETCVRTHDPECRYIPGLKRDGFGDHRRQTMFFCGHSDDCTWVYFTIRTKKAHHLVQKSQLSAHQYQHYIWWYGLLDCNSIKITQKAFSHLLS